MDAYHPQLSIRNAHKCLLVVGICGDIHLTIQYSWEVQGRNEGREGGKKRVKRHKKINKGGVGGRINHLGMQSNSCFPLQIIWMFIIISSSFNFPFNHHACLKFGLFLNRTQLGLNLPLRWAPKCLWYFQIVMVILSNRNFSNFFKKTWTIQQSTFYVLLKHS